MTGLIPAGSSAVRLAFIGAGLWDSGDYDPDLVGIPRVPVVGEHIALPDDHGIWQVVDVIFDYSRGLCGGDPVVGVICARPSEVLESRQGNGLRAPTPPKTTKAPPA